MKDSFGHLWPRNSTGLIFFFRAFPRHMSNKILFFLNCFFILFLQSSVRLFFIPLSNNPLWINEYISSISPSTCSFDLIPTQVTEELLSIYYTPFKTFRDQATPSPQSLVSGISIFSRLSHTLISLHWSFLTERSVFKFALSCLK